MQGWRKHKVYPDFLICRDYDNKFFVIETKGAHLKVNEYTEYKEKLLDILEKAYKNSKDRGEMKTGSPEISLRMLFQDDWKYEVDDLVSTEK